MSLLVEKMDLIADAAERAKNYLASAEAATVYPSESALNALSNFDDRLPDNPANPRAVLAQLDSGEMPPKKEKRQPAAAVRDRVAAWIRAELLAAGIKPETGSETRDVPQHGNRLNHDELFSGKHKGPAYSPARLWRISPYISTARRKGGQPYTLTDHEAQLRVRAWVEEAFSLLAQRPH